MKNLVTVGQKVNHSGFEGVVTKILQWSDSMVEVRVSGGIIAVCVTDLKEIDSDKFIGR